MQFTLTIDMGNDAMQSHRDIADALLTVIAKLDNEEFSDAGTSIRDANGNRVGTAKVAR